MFRIQLGDVFVSFVDVQQRSLGLIVGVIVFRVFVADKRVLADGKLVSLGHLLFFFLIERLSGDADACQHHTEVDYIAAIAPHIAPREVVHAAKNVCIQLVLQNTSAANELRGNRGNDQRAEDECQPGIEVCDALPRLGAQRNQYDSHKQRQCCGNGEVLFQAAKRGVSPCQQRANGSKEDQEQANRQHHLIKERRADGDLVAANPLGEDGEERSTQYGEAGCKKNKIVKQEAGFAGNQRLKFVLGFQVLAVLHKSRQA